jgi:DNA-directed RNA polymerase subunit N (RpoN/RPB10)
VLDYVRRVSGSRSLNKCTLYPATDLQTIKLLSCTKVIKEVKATKVLKHRLVFPENIESALEKFGLDNQTCVRVF